MFDITKPLAELEGRMRLIVGTLSEEDAPVISECADELAAVRAEVEREVADLESEVSRYRGNYRVAQAELSKLRSQLEQKESKQ